MKGDQIKVINPALLLLAQQGDSKSSPANVRGLQFPDSVGSRCRDFAKENLISQLLLAADPTPSCICSSKEQLVQSHVSKELSNYRGWICPCWTNLFKASTGRCHTLPSRKCREIRVHISAGFGEDCFWNHLVLWHHGICYCSKEEANSAKRKNETSDQAFNLPQRLKER